MNHFRLPRRAAWTALLALGTLVALAGCSKRMTGVDAGYTTLEGRPDPNVRLVAWRDVADTVVVWADLGAPGPDQNPDNPEDTLFAHTPYTRSGSGEVHTVLLDRTAASGFQYFRRASNGGLEQVTDYTVQPTLKWLPTNWELYFLDDNHPSSYSPATYEARGLLDGKVTTNSPLSNPVIATASLPTPSIRFAWGIDPVDSTVFWLWSHTPGEAGSWVDVYQLTNNTTLQERLNSGLPNPVLAGNVKHSLVAYVPYGGATPNRVVPGKTVSLAAATGATTLPTDVLTSVPLLAGQTYLVRITSVDARGNVLAWMHGDNFFHQLEGFYELIPMGAIAIKVPNR